MTPGHCSPNVPHLMEDNRIPLSYRGGSRIDAFRDAPGPIRGPEDWVGSVWKLPSEFARGNQRQDWGLSHLPDGTLLRDAITDDPAGWLGEPLANALDATPGVLIKLLDAGERLPVHFHPSRDFARRHLDAPFGKTEAWIILDAEPGASAWVGFNQDVPSEVVRDWIRRQDVEAMLAAMNRRDVAAGDAIFVPAGVPHAFGPGILLCELQEPTSFSIHMEHQRFGMDESVATLGLGWEVALEALAREAMAEEASNLWTTPWGARHAPGGRIEHLLPREALAYFDALRLEVRGELELGPPSFGVLVVLQGSGELHTVATDRDVTGGQTWVIPHGAGPTRLVGDLNALLCLPPLPEAPTNNPRSAE